MPDVTPPNFWPLTLTAGMVAWTLLVAPFGHWNSWLLYPVLLGAPVLAVWHFRLLYTKPQTFGYLLFAIANLSLYVMLAIPELMYIAHEGI